MFAIPRIYGDFTGAKEERKKAPLCSLDELSLLKKYSVYQQSNLPPEYYYHGGAKPRMGVELVSTNKSKGVINAPNPRANGAVKIVEGLSRLGING